jgi:hypothetical protein
VGSRGLQRCAWACLSLQAAGHLLLGLVKRVQGASLISIILTLTSFKLLRVCREIVCLHMHVLHA